MFRDTRIPRSMDRPSAYNGGHYNPTQLFYLLDEPDSYVYRYQRPRSQPFGRVRVRHVEPERMSLLKCLPLIAWLGLRWFWAGLKPEGRMFDD